MSLAQPVWTLFSRRTFSSLAYWLSALGFNLRDKTASNRFYLLYFVFFWLCWVVVMFAFLGSAIAPFLRSLSPGQPAAAVIALLVYGFGLWEAYWLFTAGKMSPFVFPEEDAYLLCQTPVNRSLVALAWFTQGWFPNALPVAAFAGVLSFAIVESSITGPIILPTILVYFRHSLLAILLVLPLQLALQALAWSFGAWRLQFRSPSFWFRLAPIPVLLWLGLDRWGSYAYQNPVGAFLLPLRQPLLAAFDRQSPGEWVVAMILCLLAAGLSLALLAATSRKMSLSLAAQETTRYAAIRTARLMMQFELAESLSGRQRRTASRPGHLISRSASTNILIGKDLQQFLRSISPLVLISWASLFAVSFGLFFPGNWAIQGFSLLYWVITLGTLATRRFRSDLARWWLLRSLPMGGGQVLVGELAAGVTLGVVAGWLALLFQVQLPNTFRVLAFFCLPLAAASVALAAANDILRRSKARTLMSPSIGEENVPSLNLWGIVQAFVSAAIPLGMLSWSFLTNNLATWGIVTLPVAAMIAYLNAQTAFGALDGIE